MPHTGPVTHTSAGQHVISLNLKDKALLYASYMPFIKHGGLFVATPKTYRLGDAVYLLLNLMDEPERIPVAGTVVWITPTGAQGNRVAGIGVQFNSDASHVRDKIETHLAGALQSDRPTRTL